ncbi:cytochrome c3 family protein [Desulfobacterales bacterium HSG16]|nr:cytochrome c3 family protein [Desulfobacterales bacterium HSG16]
MKEGKSLFRWPVILITVTIVSICCIGAGGLVGLSKDSEKRADVVTIDTMKIFGNLERPEVVFLHDLHTEALEKKGKDCSVCHISGKSFEVIPDTLKSAVENIDRMSPKFKRLQDASRKEVMDTYHLNCIECHTNMTADGDKTGPLACGECHKKETENVISSRQPFGLDQSLHFRHSKAQEKKCETCHHEYDEKSKKLVYVKEKEGSCRYCHLQETEENRISMKTASHLSCIDCHKKKIAKKIEAGPVKCSGCHDAENIKKIKRVAKIPRMERKQPDMIMVSTGAEDLTLRMNFVPFDHKAHETYNDTCRSCHHADLDKCSKCHTVAGSKEGKYIKLEQAMHRMDNENSCMGCHEKQQKDKKCAGCHVFMERMHKQPESSCLKCHMNPDKIKMAKQPSEEELAMIAGSMLKSRKAVKETFKDEDVPEKVIIKDMVNKYGPVELPHRKIITTLVKDMEDNSLAGYFHSEKGTVCQGCHHNSPVSKKPPRCINCHGKPFDEEDMFKPGIMGAYHMQCMGCHEEMELEKPASCTDCHKERKF